MCTYRTTMDNEGYIYAIILREFIKTKESIIKVGRSQNVFERRADYPKSSKMLFACFVSDCKMAEKLVLQVLKSRFIVRSDIGLEYFEGNINEIITTVRDTLEMPDDYFKHLTVPEPNFEKPTLNSLVTRQIKPLPPCQKRYVCPRCGLATDFKNDFIVHCQRQKVCKPIYSYTDLSLILKQFQQEYEAKPRFCDICNKRFAHHSSLSVHKKKCKENHAQSQ